MEQSFLLKYYGNIDLNEQNLMTAEDRIWWLERLDKENSAKKSNMPDANRLPNSPGKPPT